MSCQAGGGGNEGKGGGGGGGGGEKEVGNRWVGFDPTGLERAAEAARELDKSGQLRTSMTSLLYSMKLMALLYRGFSPPGVLIICVMFGRSV